MYGKKACLLWNIHYRTHAEVCFGSINCIPQRLLLRCTVLLAERADAVSQELHKFPCFGVRFSLLECFVSHKYNCPYRSEINGVPSWCLSKALAFDCPKAFVSHLGWHTDMIGWCDRIWSAAKGARLPFPHRYTNRMAAALVLITLCDHFKRSPSYSNALGWDKKKKNEQMKRKRKYMGPLCLTLPDKTSKIKLHVDTVSVLYGTSAGKVGFKVRMPATAVLFEWYCCHVNRVWCWNIATVYDLVPRECTATQDCTQFYKRWKEPADHICEQDYEHTVEWHLVWHTVSGGSNLQFEKC